MVQQDEKTKKLFSIYLIIDLYFKKIKNFYTNYIKMRKILQLIAKNFYNNNDMFLQDILQNLSLKLNSLKRYIRRHISLFKLYRKALQIIIKK